MVAECTGAVISSRWVMTAAHCIGADGSVREFEVITQQHCGAKDTPTGKGLAVKRAIRHPSYEDGTSHKASMSGNDIALLELQQPLPKDMMPICLDNSDKFTNFFAAGWGKNGTGKHDETKCLLETSLRKKPLSACHLADKTPKHLVLCAGGGGSNTCRGDSGGALMSRKDGHVYAVAVVSNGPPCDQGKPGIFEKVAPHLLWIQKTTNNEVCIG
jgi:secreted trypsin-like serine protease